LLGVVVPSFGFLFLVLFGGLGCFCVWGLVEVDEVDVGCGVI
jgi:hypothetical protein